MDAQFNVETSSEVLPGDQIKVRVRLTRAEMGDWEKIKRAVLTVSNDMQVELCGIEVERIEERPRLVKRRTPQTPQQMLTAWAERQQVTPQLISSGQELLASVLP